MAVKNVALITAPGLAKRLGDDLKEELPAMLSYYISEEYEWHVELHEDPLTGGTNNSTEVLESALKRKDNAGWDYAVALTDLPLFEEEKPIVAEVFKDRDVALISFPGFGAVPMHKRVREAILQLMNEIHFGSSDADREEAQQRIRSKDNRYDDLKNKKSTRLVGKRMMEIVSPMKRETPGESDPDIVVRFTLKSRITGLMRVVSGMVYANRPWEMFAAFGKILVIAFTTGAYAFVFGTLWQLNTTYSIERAVLMMIFSILALTIWIIMGHGLWEKKSEQSTNFIRNLYNATTFFTLLISVVMYYVILFTMFLIWTLFLQPPAQLEIYTSEPVGLATYLYTSWIGASISTIIGALGSFFENKEVVLNSTYGYRQQQRHEKIEELREKEEEEKNDKS